MKRIRFVVGLGLLASSLAFPQQATARTPGVGEQIESLEAQLREASLRGDVAFFERTLADDFSHTGPSGETITRAEMIADCKSGAVTYATLDRNDVRVRVFGDVAIVTERDLMKGSFRNHYFNGRYRVIRVWVRLEGRWQVSTSQATFFVERVGRDSQNPSPTEPGA